MQIPSFNRNFILGAILLPGALIVSSCDNDDDAAPVAPNTITKVVVDNNDFSTLEAAVVRANLATTLDDNTKAYTVFAPDNAAFTTAGITDVNTIPVADLSNILLYHTLGSKVVAADVPAGPNAKVTTASGDSVFVTKNAAGIFVNGIKVKTGDVSATNGVIHVLENVLIPPSGNIVVTAQANPQFSYLVAAVVRASSGTTNVASVLSSGGPFTVFAPTNDAFIAAGFPTIASINAADPNTLAGILTYHVVAGRIFSSNLTEGAQPITVNGGKVTVTLAGGAKVKGNANATASNIVRTNIMARNGVVHVIDRVLLP